MIHNMLKSFKYGGRALTPLASLRAPGCRGVASYAFDTLKVETVSPYVVQVSLNRPEKHNAMNKVMWTEIGDAFARLGTDPDCRCVVLAGEGKNFSSGIDIADFVELGATVMGDADVARKSFKLKTTIEHFQDCFTALEKCPKPVVAAVGGACVGGGVDLVACTDVRFCSGDAYFQVKEVDLGLAADVGTLQRLPKLVGSQSLVAELCLSCRRFPAAEALDRGLVSRVLPDGDQTLAAARAFAASVAAKSPVAVQATKMTLLHARDHSVQDGLDFVKFLNMTLLQSEDVRRSIAGLMSKGKEPAEFEPL